jgi:hypothetical protein
METAVRFSYEPPVSAEQIARWQADLETVVPRTTRVPWLKIVWQSGWEYEPVQRFELYEMHPVTDWVPGAIMESLQGPSPREVGVWHIGPDGIKRWISDSLVSLMQWNLYRETGCYSSRYWIIQGNKGGHRLQWNGTERAFFQMQYGETADLPLPGALPYAPYDERVKQQVIRADRMRQWKQALAWDERAKTKDGAAKFLAEHKAALSRQLNETMLKFLDEQIGAAVDGVSQKALDQYMNAPLDPDFDRKYEAQEQAILQGA